MTLGIVLTWVCCGVNCLFAWQTNRTRRSYEKAIVAYAEVRQAYEKAIAQLEAIERHKATIERNE